MVLGMRQLTSGIIIIHNVVPFYQLSVFLTASGWPGCPLDLTKVHNARESSLR